MEQNYNSFLIMAKEIANYISIQSFVRIFSHNDADGIVSASILMETFNRKNIKYHTTFISKIDFDFITKFEKDLEKYHVLFLDIGSNYLHLFSKFKKITILDHHIYFKDNNKFLPSYFLNSENFNISGSFHACASSICYIISKFIDPNNYDLSSLALVGIDGDRQLFESLNKIVLNDAIDNNLIKQEYGYKLGGDYLYNIFLTSIEPYLDITGDLKKIQSFFSNLNIPNKKVFNLSEHEIKKLEQVIFKELDKYSCSDSIEFIFGTYYSLQEDIITNIHDFSCLITSCCQLNKAGLGVSLCFRDFSIFNEVNDLYLKINKCIVNDLLSIDKTKIEMKFLYYFYGKNIVSSGEIASSLSRYKYNSKVVICFNETSSGIKVSGRCSTKLISEGINLSFAFYQASKEVGGSGGGHLIASGGLIPTGTIESFVSKLDFIFEKQINN